MGVRRIHMLLYAMTSLLVLAQAQFPRRRGNALGGGFRSEAPCGEAFVTPAPATGAPPLQPSLVNPPLQPSLMNQQPFGPGGPTLAQMYGLPPGMTLLQASMLELDLNSPYDLDPPDFGLSSRAAVGRTATRRVRRQGNAPPPPPRTGPTNRRYTGFRVCQCDSAEDCNLIPTSQGRQYAGQCRFGLVCCCRLP